MSGPLVPLPDFIESALRYATVDQLRAELHRRGLEIHSQAFSKAAQQAIRELESLRKRVDELVADFRAAEGNAQ